MSTPCISIVLPVYNEADNIGPRLEELWAALQPYEHEILVCYDFDEDTTLPAIAAMPSRPPTVHLVKNELGPGVACAMRAGMQAATGDVVVTTTADLSDPPDVIPRMAEKIRREGADVVSGSRYMRAGSQKGGPLLKRLLSQAASLSLYWVAGIQTHDATTNFRAYSRKFLQRVQVESDQGLEMGLELTIKAHLQGGKVTEVPSSWVDRSAAHSRFRLRQWLLHDLRWYGTAMAAPTFVWGIWAVMVVALFYFVAHYGVNVPFYDDYANVPYVTGHKPLNAEWLWRPHNEHRIPIPRLSYVGLVYLGGGDVRAVMFFNIACLSLVAFAFILTVRQLRGWMAYSDALFPLVLLHWGDATNILWSFQIAFFETTLLMNIVLLIVSCSCTQSQARGMKLPSFVPLALCILALPLCSAPGMAMSPVLILWLGYAGVASLRGGSRRTRRVGFAILIATFVAYGLITSLYMVGFGGPKSASSGLRATFFATAEFLSLGVGPAGTLFWPFFAYFMIVVCLLTAVLLAWRWVSIPKERVRIAGFLFCLGALLVLALAIGHGRAGVGIGAGHRLRYVTLASPILCLSYIVWMLYAHSWANRFAQWSLFVVVFAVALINLDKGISIAHSHHYRLTQFQKDVWKGRMSAAELATRHSFLFPRREPLVQYIALLQETEYGPFQLSEDQREEALRNFYRERYPMFESTPYDVYSSKTKGILVDGELALQVHAPGWMRFRVSPGFHTVTGRFGLSPRSYTKIGKTDGAVFRVKSEDENGEVVLLFERFLNPLQVDEDQGSQIFTLEFYVDTNADLVLETQAGPAKNSRWDWSYWTQIKIE